MSKDCVLGRHYPKRKDLLLLPSCVVIRTNLINFLDVPHSSAVVEIAVVLVAVHWEYHSSAKREKDSQMTLCKQEIKRNYLICSLL